MSDAELYCDVELDEGDGLAFDIDLPNFDNLNFEFESRYSAPIKQPEVPEQYLLYEDAKKMAKSIKVGRNERQFFVLNGSFIFGDLIEAFVIDKGIFVEEMTISTLSMSQANIDSLGNLLLAGWVKKLDLIISDFWYAHERLGLVPYLLKELDVDNKLQIAVTRTHTKIVLIRTTGGLFYVIHGSANLRSSNNIEQITVEENKRMYYFLRNFHSRLIDRFKIIDKTIRQAEAWKLMHEANKEIVDIKY